MSWLFFGDDRVYKLKKPVKTSYLDFSTLERREAACRSEIALNRRLAPGVYLGVEALGQTDRGLSIGARGEIVDWLVVMRRLDDNRFLAAALLQRRVAREELDRTALALVRFYRRARTVPTSPELLLGEWRRNLEINRSLLLDTRWVLPRGLVRWVDSVQRRFLSSRAEVLARRAREGRILDAHGDLRPEHIWLDAPVRIIDCLEFNDRLRANDPLDEIAFLDLECEFLGAPAAGERLRRRLTSGLSESRSRALYRFYRSYRAMLRAHLSIAHLLEPSPRTPAKWRPQALAYLALAAKDAARLEVALRTPEDR